LGVNGRVKVAERPTPSRTKPTLITLIDISGISPPLSKTKKIDSMTDDLDLARPGLTGIDATIDPHPRDQ
jgi:hypothetical protein